MADINPKSFEARSYWRWQMGSWPARRPMRFAAAVVPAFGAMLTIAVAGISSRDANAQNDVLGSLPREVRQRIEEIRAECRAWANENGEIGNPVYNQSGDQGLISFLVDGQLGVIVAPLHLCGDGISCHKGLNCATGFTHSVDIFVRLRGNNWRKMFSEHVTEPVHVGIDRASKEFKFLAFKLPGWDDQKCPVPPRVKRESGPTAWKAHACDFILRWDSGRFVYNRM